MKKIWNKILGINLVATMISITMLPIGIGASEIITPSEKIDVVFTNDLHSHLEPFTVKTEDGQEELGGFARIANFIKSKQSEAEDLLVLDAGDFSMGTLYQTDTSSSLGWKDPLEKEMANYSSNRAWEIPWTE